MITTTKPVLAAVLLTLAVLVALALNGTDPLALLAIAVIASPGAGSLLKEIADEHTRRFEELLTHVQITETDVIFDLPDSGVMPIRCSRHALTTALIESCAIGGLLALVNYHVHTDSETRVRLLIATHDVVLGLYDGDSSHKVIMPKSRAQLLLQRLVAP